MGRDADDSERAQREARAEDDLVRGRVTNTDDVFQRFNVKYRLL